MFNYSSICFWHILIDNSSVNGSKCHVWNVIWYLNTHEDRRLWMFSNIFNTGKMHFSMQFDFSFGVIPFDISSWTNLLCHKRSYWFFLRHVTYHIMRVYRGPFCDVISCSMVLWSCNKMTCILVITYWLSLMHNFVKITVIFQSKTTKKE